MAVSLKLKLIVICAAIGFDYIITTMMNFLGMEPSLYGNYLTFWNALVVFWVVLPSRVESPFDNIE
jgi:hypothetical protein